MVKRERERGEYKCERRGGALDEWERKDMRVGTQSRQSGELCHLLDSRFPHLPLSYQATALRFLRAGIGSEVTQVDSLSSSACSALTQGH